MMDVARRENSSPMNHFQRTRLTVTGEMPIRYGLVLDGDKRSDVADFWAGGPVCHEATGPQVPTAGRSVEGKGAAVRESYASGFA